MIVCYLILPTHRTLYFARYGHDVVCLDSHESPDASERARGNCVMASQRSFPDTNLPSQFISRAQFSKRMSVVSRLRVRLARKSRPTYTRMPASREWRNVKLNEGGEEGRGGWGGGGGGRRRRGEKDEREESPPSFERSHNVTCERCLLSHNDER